MAATDGESPRADSTERDALEPPRWWRPPVAYGMAWIAGAVAGLVPTLALLGKL